MAGTVARTRRRTRRGGGGGGGVLFQLRQVGYAGVLEELTGECCNRHGDFLNAFYAFSGCDDDFFKGKRIGLQSLRP